MALMSFPPQQIAGDIMVVLLMISNLHSPYKKKDSGPKKNCLCLHSFHSTTNLPHT